MSEEKKVATIYDFSRVCRAHRDCSYCPARVMADGHKEASCLCLICDHPEKLSDAVLKWCALHPVKTYKQDFLEKFPKCNMYISNIGYAACRQRVYEGQKTSCSHDCEKCWNEPMPKEE